MTDINPRGSTPLLDALGHVIVRTGETLAAMAEDQRPARVIVVVSTDGKENDSREYSREVVGGMITEQTEKYGWDFVFIGAGFDAFTEGAKIGVPRESTVSVKPQDFVEVYAATSNAVSRSRKSGLSVSYSADERKQAGSE